MSYKVVTMAVGTHANLLFGNKIPQHDTLVTQASDDCMIISAENVDLSSDDLLVAPDAQRAHDGWLVSPTTALYRWR